MKFIKYFAVLIGISLAGCASGKTGHIKVMHYNILAKSYGSNYMPWFLYGASINNCKQREKRSQQIDGIIEISDHATNNNTERFGPWVQKCLNKNHGGGSQENISKCIPYKKVFSDRDLIEINAYDRRYFSWKTREQKILKAIKKEMPDLLSLVELDEPEYFSNALRKLGYDNLFLKRPKPNVRDGSGIFYKSSRFSLSESVPVVFSDQDRSALIGSFYDLKNNRKILFVSTHLMRDPDDDKKERVRIAEIKELEAAIKTLRPANNTPVIVAGDFNAVPLGPAYQQMKDFGYSTTQAFLKNASKKPCTSKTILRDMWIDYFWYQDLQLIDENKPKFCSACDIFWPNEEQGSDHIPIVAVYSYNQNTTFFISPTIFENAPLHPFPRYLAKPFFYKPVDSLLKDIETAYNLELKSRKEAHATIVNPAEYEKINSFVSLEELNKMAEPYIKDLPFNITCLGLSKAWLGGKEERVYYLIIDSKQLISLRKAIYEEVLKRGGSKTSFVPENYFPHITVGFTLRDLHPQDGVKKDKSSCIADVSTKI